MRTESGSFPGGTWLVMSATGLDQSARQLSGMLADQADDPIWQWRGLREADRHLWLVPAGSARKAAAEKAAGSAGLHHIFAFAGSVLKAWSWQRGLQAPAANFVVRELAPAAAAGARGQIMAQFERVLARPGCQGGALFVEQERPFVLMGMTSWASVDAFEAYSIWAGQHPWKDEISPITQEVPLRLLAGPAGGPNRAGR